jgi:predicted glycoside hydrolase/deacetylase ChbG (UPF0249 family)
MSGSSDVIPDNGYQPDLRQAIIHADDVGMCHGANVAFAELSALGSITCGAVMVPCPWFLEILQLVERNPDLDIGVHLTLTSEWECYRWGPISTISRNSGLIDAQGYFWHRTPMLAEHVVPEAAEVEMRAQIDRALSFGLDITHLDAHMGVAFIPELFDIYLRLGKDYQLPVLLPRTIADYTSVLELGDHTLDRYEDAVKDMEHLGWPLVDHFRMTPGVPTEQARSAYYELIGSLPGGLTYVALHPTRPGEIESIVPPRAHYRTDEYRLLQEPNFLEFVHHQKITTIGFRKIRDRLRGTVSPLS